MGKENKKKKTALVLSGGGARGAYEVGVWKALKELKVPIDMVFGTSVGAINGAMVAQGQLELSEKLWKELNTNQIFDIEPEETKKARKKQRKELAEKISVAGMSLAEAHVYAKKIISDGGASNEGLRSILEKYVDEQAVRKSKIEYGLATVEITKLSTHYLRRADIPSGKMVDYILASAAVFPAVKPQEIDGKQFIDGGFADVLPVKMAFDCRATDIICVYLEALGHKRKISIKDEEYVPDSITTIQSAWDLGNVLLFDRENAARLLTLGYLDTMKKFGRYYGSFYALDTGKFTKKEASLADSAGKIFDLPPERVYTKEDFDREIFNKICEINQKLDDNDKEKEQKGAEKTAKSLSQKIQTIKNLAEDGISVISDGFLKPGLVIAMAKSIIENENFAELVENKSFAVKGSAEAKAAKYIAANKLV